MREIYPEYQTVGKRKEERQEIRHRLGTSSDDAPRLGALFTVAKRLDFLLRLTSGCRYGITIVNRYGEPVSVDEQAEAIVAFREY